MTEGATTAEAERYRQTLSDMADLAGEQGRSDNWSAAAVLFWDEAPARPTLCPGADRDLSPS